MGRELSGRPLWALIFVFLAAQTWFASEFRGLRMAIEEIPPPPTARALEAMALGDEEFLFRYLGRWIEFVGDGGGRLRALRFYDYDRVVNWMEALDRLDADRSDLVHMAAAHYFGAITTAVDPQHSKLRKIVDYLRAVGTRDPARFWPWLVWDSDKARWPIGDSALIVEIARDLQSPKLKDPRVPAWVRVLPAHLFHVAGDDNAARDAQAHIAPEDLAEVAEMHRRLNEGVAKSMRK